MSAKQEIAFLVIGNEGYGVRRMVTGLVRQYRQWELDVTVYCISPGPLVQDCEGEGARVIVLSGAPGPAPIRKGAFARLGEQLVQQAQLFRSGRALLRAARRPTLIGLIVRTGALLRLAGMFAARQRVPCLWLMPNTVNDDYPLDANRRAYRAVIGRYGIQPVANSTWTASSLGPSPVPTLVSSLGVDPAQFDPLREPVSRASMRVPESAALAGIMARLIPEKGQDRVLKAMIALKETARDLHLLLCGGPTETPFAQGLVAAAKAAGLEDRIHIVGSVSDPVPYYLACDFAINSRVGPEPFGLSVIEAMMLGRPVLTHALGGPADTVVDGLTGWHAADMSVETFSASLARVLNERSRWTILGDAARQRALRLYTLEAVSERLLRMLRAAQPCADRSVFAASYHALKTPRPPLVSRGLAE